MEYVLILSIGIIIGMLLIIIIDIKKEKTQEKMHFEEYKELISKCFETSEENKKKEFK